MIRSLLFWNIFPLAPILLKTLIACQQHKIKNQSTPSERFNMCHIERVSTAYSHVIASPANCAISPRVWKVFLWNINQLRVEVLFKHPDLHSVHDRILCIFHVLLHLISAFFQAGQRLWPSYCKLSSFHLSNKRTVEKWQVQAGFSFQLILSPVPPFSPYPSSSLPDPFQYYMYQSVSVVL